MKKILLTTIFGLCVAFVEGDTLNIGNIDKRMGNTISINVRNQIKNVFFDDININAYLQHVRNCLIDNCNNPRKHSFIMKDPGNSVLFNRLRRIFPDVKHIYYCYKRYVSDEIKEIRGEEGKFSFFITSEDVDKEINERTFETKTKVQYINFVINTNTCKLTNYFAAYGNNSELADTLAFYKVFSPNDRVIVENR